jgi:hypothetical protein
MYKILGGDGKEYGPISADVLRQWITEGRANAQSQVQVVGSSAWVSLGQVAEFAPLFNAPLSGGAPSTFSTGVANSDQAQQQVNGPAIGLMIMAGIGVLWQLFSIVLNILGTGVGMMGANQGQQEMPAWAHAMQGGVGIVFGVIGLIVAVVIFMGAMKMKKLESYNFAMSASIIAMVPCVSPCCLIGLPIGIWALVVLMKPEVKGAFQTGS